LPASRDNLLRTKRAQVRSGTIIASELATQEEEDGGVDGSNDGHGDEGRNELGEGRRGLGIRSRLAHDDGDFRVRSAQSSEAGADGSGFGLQVRATHVAREVL